ncbi:MAG: redoxin domain-containing protein [Deltaproteobacteria bacterium]|nr:redoxin domain-containing protein [Deltaproteobacteria bacterium]
MECKSLRESGEAIRRYEVAYYAASVDPVEKNTEFAKKLELDYPILSDPGKEVARAYGVLLKGVGVASRHTFYIGKDGKILKVDRDVSPSTAGADVARTLAELGVALREAQPSE